MSVRHYTQRMNPAALQTRRRLQYSLVAGVGLASIAFAALAIRDGARNGTRILKFFLHLSKEEQRQRFLARLDDPEKNWKFCMADIEERERWDDYQRAYEDALSATSTAHAPWYVVPADDKQNARLIVSQVIVEALDALDMHYPASTLSAEQLQDVRRRLAK